MEGNSCYEVKCNFLNCIGAIDGKHFRIVKLKNVGLLFDNYKGYCSVQMLAPVDANYRFTYAEVVYCLNGFIFKNLEKF